MQFSVLGQVGITVNGRPIVLGRGHERTILAVLLAADGRFVSFEQLIDALWGESPPSSALKSLQSHVSRLRRRLREVSDREREIVSGVPGGYQLTLTPGQLDTHQFSDLLARAAQAQDSYETVALLKEADAWWHSRAFGDLAHHPGLRDTAAHWQRQRRAAAMECAQLLVNLDRRGEAIELLRTVLADDPYNEQVHVQLMHALVAEGRRAEALAVYERLRVRLREELGIDPAPDTRGLYQQILQQDRAPPTRTDEAGPQPIRKRRKPLFGRQRDLEQLSMLLPDATLLTLTGSGGVGKTALAERVADHTQAHWRDGVVYCPLAQIRDETGVGGAIMTALGLQSVTGQPVSQILVRGLGTRQILLLLDNCAHVVDTLVPLVDAILAGCPNVTVLATSRERLRLPGERVWPVYPLELPPRHGSTEEVLAAAAGRLFDTRAAEAEPTFRLNDDNAPKIAQLCRRLDGLPLAIELAAARIRALSPQALVDRLDQRFTVLAGGPVYEGGRHQTLETVVKWSYDLLAPQEADLFDRLAVFAGAVGLIPIESICADRQLPAKTIAGLLGELVDKSMVTVQRDQHGTRYRLLETMREFGLRRLRNRQLDNRLQQAHARYYLGLAELEGNRTRGIAEPQAVRAITAAMDELRAAHSWAISNQDLDVALGLPGSLVNEVRFRLRDEITTWARRSLGMANAAQHPMYPRALVTSAWGATSRNECDRAVREATQARTALDHSSALAMTAADAMATAALYEGRLEEVLRLSDLFYLVAQHSDYDLAFLEVYRILAHLYRGEAHLASRRISTLNGAAERSGSPTMRAFAHYCEGELHLEQDSDRATSALAAAVKIGRTVHNRLVEGVALVCLASSQGRRGDAAQALRAFKDVVVHWRTVGDHTHQLTAVRNLVALLADMNFTDEAAFLYGAVSVADTPSFGVEAQRLATAWHGVQTRLGQKTAQQLADQGRRVEARQIGDEALKILTTLLEN